MTASPEISPARHVSSCSAGVSPAFLILWWTEWTEWTDGGARSRGGAWNMSPFFAISSSSEPAPSRVIRTGTRSRAGTARGTCPRSCPASSSSGISWPSVTALLSMKISGGRPGMGLHSGGLTYLLAGMYNESDADWRDAGPVPEWFQECLCGICSECWEYGTQNGTYVRSMTVAGPCVWLSHSPRCFGASRDFRPELPAGRPCCVVRSV